MNKRIKKTLVFLLSLMAYAALPAPAVAINETPVPAASEPPAFFTSIFASGQGFMLYGTFPELDGNIQTVRPMYSLDGQVYSPINPADVTANDWNLDWDFTDPQSAEDAKTQPCAFPSEEPFASYLAGEIESFYLRLHVTAQDATSFDTAAALITRGEPTPLPDSLTVMTGRYPTAMRVLENRLTFGVYCVTAREGATPEEIRALLPDTLPIEVQVFSGLDIVGVATVEGRIAWPLPGEPLTMAGYTSARDFYEVTFPPNAQIKTQTAIYTLGEGQSITMGMPLELRVSAVPKDAKAAPALYTIKQNPNNPIVPFEMGFPLKPSGATAILPSYSLDGGLTWAQAGDVLARNKPVDHEPKNADYGHITLFYAGETPYREYVAGEIPGFLVRVDVAGGVFNGPGEVLPWPAEYTYKPSPITPEGDGAIGNRGNAGADAQSGHNGVRLGIPEEVIEPPAPPAEMAEEPDEPVEKPPEADQGPRAVMGTGGQDAAEPAPAPAGKQAPNQTGGTEQTEPPAPAAAISAQVQTQGNKPGPAFIAALSGAALIIAGVALLKTAVGARTLYRLSRFFKLLFRRPLG